IRPERRVKLVAADVDGIDPSGAGLEQRIREPAGRSADIERDPALGGKPKGIERRRELDAAARHAAAWLLRDGAFGAFIRKRARLGSNAAADRYATARNEVAGPRARGGEPARHQQLIETHANHRRRAVTILRWTSVRQGARDRCAGEILAPIATE